MPNKLLLVRLNGGMGNQMFQYASARALASRHQLDLALDVHTGFENDPYQRRYELGCFPLGARVLSEAEARCLQRCSPVRKYGLFLAERIAIRKFGQFFLPVDLFVGWGRLCLVNRFQSYRYFETAAPLIRNDFRFPQELPARVRETANQICTSASVSVHLRLQHGLSDDNRAIYGPDRIRPTHDVLRTFYSKAFQTIANSVVGSHFFLFSDTAVGIPPELTAFPVTRIIRNSCDPSWYDMQLMSQCKYNIIANSTFSWWAAWLNACPGKKVYAPRQFLPFISKHYPRNVYPPNWTVL